MTGSVEGSTCDLYVVIEPGGRIWGVEFLVEFMKAVGWSDLVFVDLPTEALIQTAH